MVRRLAVAAVVAAIVLAAAGCLTPLTSQPPLAPVPASATPLVGVYEPGAPGSWSQIAEFTGATGVKPKIVVYYSPWGDPFSTSFAQTANQRADHRRALRRLREDDQARRRARGRAAPGSAVFQDLRPCRPESGAATLVI